MGTYATTTSLETLWGGTSFTGLTAQASEFIDEAEAEANKYLAVRYDIGGSPFLTSTTIPPAVTNICKWLAIGYLYEANSRGSKEAYQRADRYIKKATKNLEDLRDYKAELVDISGDIVEDKSDNLQILSSSSDYAPTFNEDDELNWGVDSTKLDDISSERS